MWEATLLKPAKRKYNCQVQENRLRIAAVVLAVAATLAISRPLKPQSTSADGSRTTTQPGLRQQEEAKEIWIGDVLFDEDTLKYNGYVVEKQHKKVRYDQATGMQSQPSWIDVSFAVLKRKGNVLARFDDNIYFGMGNFIRVGLFPFLGGPTKQLLVSQDIPRGGTQWIVSLVRQPHIIFDGPRWGVGREGDDLRIIDLDNDGVFEIVLPITDFYDFQDKLPIARIPLPEIIFKYDSRAMKYVPANPRFERYALRGISDSEVEKATDEFDQRALILGKLLALIYVGNRSQAWDLYNTSYKLSDKEEIRRRVKAILITQPVYRFIYNSRGQR